MTPAYSVMLLKHDRKGTEPPAWLLKLLMPVTDDQLCVLGEHTDWAAGYRNQNRAIPPGFTLVATTREGLHARVKARTDGRLVFSAAPSTCGAAGASAAAGGAASDGAAVRTLDVAMTEEALKGVIEARGFFMYVAGTALVVCSRFGLFSMPFSRPPAPEPPALLPIANGVSGADGVTIDNHLTTLPLKKGLSSSAAVCVLVVRALCLAYGLELSVPQVMELAHLGEARCGSRCGRMDQCCALGANHVAAMFFDGEDVQIYEVAPPECGIFLVVADLNGSKDTIKMLACLNKAFPYAKDEEEERVHRYTRDNTELVWKAVSAIEQGDAQELGRAMAAAQASFDECAIPICPSEFSSPLLHNVMSDQRVQALTWGIKGVGAQGDGSVQMLARGVQEQEELIRVLKDMGMGGVLPVTVIRSMEPRASDKSIFLATEVSVPPAGDGAGGRGTGDRSSGGELATEGNHPSMPPQPSPPPPASLVQLPPRMLHPRRVKTAVLVAAGLSTRMFPASAVVKKELFPIVDHDGVCKPVILAIMEGLVESGIERFVVVVQQKDIAVFDKFFSMKAVEKHKHRLKPPQRAYCARIEALRPRITYAVQEQQEGFGHAVFCARHALLPASRTTATTSNSDIDSVAATNGNKHKKSAGCNGCTNGPDGSGGEGVGGSFLLVLGDHLYRRGAGTTQACANQLIHAFLEHGEAEKPAIGLKVMGESSVSPYGVAAGTCVAHPPPHIVERWHRAATTVTTPTDRNSSASTTAPPQASAKAAEAAQAAEAAEAAAGTETATAQAQETLPLGGRVYRLDKLVEKPTAQFARENLVTPGLGRGDGDEGRHLVVFGQASSNSRSTTRYILPIRRTFDILAEDIKLDRRERGEFQLTSVLDHMRQEDGGMLGSIIHGDALDMGIPSPYVETMGAFAMPHHA
ncbi:unnamed protein product [Pylaiella littoralis]